jgi:hypothetical protein
MRIYDDIRRRVGGGEADDKQSVLSELCPLLDYPRMGYVCHDRAYVPPCRHASIVKNSFKVLSFVE